VTHVSLAMAVLLTAVQATAASAQSGTAVPGRLEFDGGVLWMGAQSLGSRDANLTTGTGSTLRLFSSTSDLLAVAGFEGRIAVKVTRALEAHASMSYAKPELRTRVSNDTENSVAVTASESVQQYIVGAGLLWYLPSKRSGPRLRPFVAAGAAYLRQRKALQAQVKGTQAAVKLLEQRRQRVAAFYNDYDQRRLLVAEYHVLADKAADFDGRSYDLRTPAGRAQFKARLLSFIRPEAREVILEIAQHYHDQFGRPLPITSLVRTERYQQKLGEVNANATQIAIPPHTSGLAFDVYDRYMTAGEQNELMRYVAKLKDEGRVEALRENRDHIHIYAFADGRRPSETLIARSLDSVRPALMGSPRRAPALKKGAVRRPAASRGVLRPALSSSP